MNKKRVLTILLLSLVFLSVLTLVAAQPSTADIVKSVTDFFEPILEAIFGPDSGGLIFEELIFALIIISAVYMALSRVDVIRNNNFALWTISIGSAILAVRYIATENFVNFLLLPTGVFGIALLTMIPFLVYFWFVEFGIIHKTPRKIAWAVYAAIYLVLWWKHFYSETGQLVNLVEGTEMYAYIYLIAAGIAIILIFMDGTVQKYRKKIAAEKALAPGAYIRYTHLLKDRDEAQEAYLEAMRRGDTAAATSIQGRIASLDKAIAKALP